MSGNDLRQPGLGELRAVVEAPEPARAVPGLAAPAAGSRYLSAAGGAADRAIRVSTAAVVLAVAGIAAYISYWHAYAVVRQYGESGITAQLEPATIDGLVYASSMFFRGRPSVA
jgi:Protein of unknown function (DUF2637)